MFLTQLLPVEHATRSARSCAQLVDQALVD